MVHVTTSYQNEIMVVSGASVDTGAATDHEFGEKEFGQ